MITKDLGMVTAYAYAVAGGYTGTEAEFTQLMADLAIEVDEFENFSVTVTGLPAGSVPTASYENGVLSLGIPKGDKGDQGDQGIQGETGATPQLSIGTVTTLPPSGSSAVTITGTAENPVLNFDLVKGDTGEVSQAELDEAVTDLKAEITAFTGNELISLTNRYYIKTNYSVGQTLPNLTPTSGSADNNYAIVNASEGDKFTINGAGGNGARLWCFVDSNLKVLAVANANVTGTALVLTAPATTDKLIINAATGYGIMCKGIYLTDRVDDLRCRQKAITDGFVVNSNQTTDLYLKAGETVTIDVTNIIGSVNAYIAGHTDTQYVQLLSSVEKYTYVAPFDGYLTFLPLSGASFSANVFLVTEMGEAINELVPSVNNAIQELYTSKTLSLELGSLDTSAGTDTSSSTTLRTPTYINQSAVKLTFQNCKVRFFAYKQDGTFVGGYSATEGFTKDWSKYTRLNSPVYISDIGGDNYLFRLVFDQFSGAVDPANANAKLEISNIRESKSEEYTVGTNGDFATFTEMLVALANNANEKVVYVNSGTYDIFEEMGGAEYMETVDTSANWRDVCHVVPSNTTIIGVGDVVLSWNPTDAQIIDQSHAFLFSPLNLSGTCKIVNIKVECSNCRYGIHDETSGKNVFDGSIHEFEDVSVIYSASTYGVHYAYGAGHNKNMKLRFKNCLFSSAYGTSWSTHDWYANASESSLFDFDNCVFLDNRTNSFSAIRFSSSDTVGRLDDVKINGCEFSNISFSTEDSVAIKQGYVVRTMLCKPVVATYSSYIASADRIAPTEYLTIN